MIHWETDALNKLEEGKKNVTGQKEKIMAGPVAEQLKNFCQQDEEFAQAVVQGGTFSQCMKKVAEGVGQSVSDLDAYKKAVQFYFPGAEVRMQLTIDLIGSAAAEGTMEAEPIPKPEVNPKIISLDLADFF